MKYESQVRKILKTIQTENQNHSDANELIKYDLLARSDNFSKQVGKISLVKGFDMTTGTTTPDGFVNPMVTVTRGIPQIPPPPINFNIVADFTVAGNPVLIPNALLNGNQSLLLVVNTDTEVPVPDVVEDMPLINVTVTPSNTNTPAPPVSAPVFIAPNVVQINLGPADTNVTGTTPTVTINVQNTATQENIAPVVLNLQPVLNVTPSLNGPSLNMLPSFGGLMP